MNRYKSMFTNYLDGVGIKWTDVDDDRIRISYTGDNLNSIRVLLTFDDDQPMITLNCWDIANFKSKREVGISVCNQLNNDYRWVKFRIDDDGDVCCTRNVYSPVEDSRIFGELGKFGVLRIVSIVDTVYPDIMKALWA